MIEQEMKNCKDCIAYERCPSGQQNPITRICYSNKYFAQEYANKGEVKAEDYYILGIDLASIRGKK